MGEGERMAEQAAETNLGDAIAMLSDPDARVRLTGVWSVGRFGSTAERAAPQLFGLLRDASDDIRKMAISTLCNIGYATEVIARLPKLVNDPSPDVRQCALSLPKELGLEAGTIVDILFDRSKDRGNANEFGGTSELIDFLGSLGVAAILPLMQLLADEDDNTVNLACRALTKFGPVAAEAVPKITALLESPRADTWTEAATALAAIGPGSYWAVPTLVEFLEHNVLYYAFFEALGRIGSAAADAIPELIRIFWQFTDDDEFQDLVGETLRKIGFEALPRFRSAAIQAIPTLLKRLQTHYSWFEEVDIGNATVAIFRVAPELVVPKLLKASLSGEQPHTYQTTEVLEKIGPAAISILLDEAASSSQRQVLDIVESVVLDLNEDARPALLAASRASKPAVASLASRLLALIDEEAEYLAEQGATNSTFGEQAAGTDVSATDEQILAWFMEIDLEEYLKPLQVFWCIGYLQRESLKSAGRSLGQSKLQTGLRSMSPSFKFKSLPTGVTYLGGMFRDLDGLFDREPFYSNAWSDEERGLELRPRFMYGERPEASWTKKSWTAWQYVDRFLTTQGLLPTFTKEGG